MFEFGRDLKRLFRKEAAFAAPRDGLTGGDGSLLELLDLRLLTNEARGCDVAAGRIGATDRPARQLRQAAAWREVARRSGDAVALRKAASCAEAAVSAINRASSGLVWARARLEQARCAMLGAELFGDSGLNAAADLVLADIAARLPAAAVERARIASSEALSQGDHGAALEAATACGGALVVLDRQAQSRPARLEHAEARLIHADLLLGCGMAALDDRVVARALGEAEAVFGAVDPAYEPVTHGRAGVLMGETLVALGEMTGEPAALVRAVDHLTGLFDDLTRDHSPLDWARGQVALAHALQALGEATGTVEALDRSRGAFDRALLVLKRNPDMPLRALVAHARAGLIASQARMTEDVMAFTEAEAAFRCELASIDASADPVGWAVAQLGLAEIYIGRMSLTGQDRGERASAAMALDMSLEVFGDHGLWSLSNVTADRLKALCAGAAA